jgi:transcriptional regulator of arginine metabolism
MSATLAEAVKNLLSNGGAGTQDQLIQTLADQGVHTTQPTLSRLLRKLGAVKMINAQGEAVYSLAREPLPPPTHAPLSQLVIEITANESMIVIHTNPGSASLIARVLDHHAPALQILGTLAGDDTLFVVPKSTRHIPTVVDAIREQLAVTS